MSSVAEQQQVEGSVGEKDAEAATPFTMEELLAKGRLHAHGRVVPFLQEDAAQDFALAGIRATEKAAHTANIRAYQLRAGKWAVGKLQRTEMRREKHEQKLVAAALGCFMPLAELAPDSVVDRQGKSPTQKLIAREESLLLRKAINALPKRKAQVMEMLVYQDKTQQTVADELGLSRGYVGQLYTRSLEVLKDMLSGPRLAPGLKLTNNELFGESEPRTHALTAQTGDNSGVDRSHHNRSLVKLLAMKSRDFNIQKKLSA